LLLALRAMDALCLDGNRPLRLVADVDADIVFLGRQLRKRAYSINVDFAVNY